MEMPETYRFGKDSFIYSTLRMDLITDSADGLYASFEHRRMAGFRIYPGA